MRRFIHGKLARNASAEVLRQPRRATSEGPELPRSRSTHNRVAADLVATNHLEHRVVAESYEMRITRITHEPRAHFVVGRGEAPHIEVAAARLAVVRGFLHMPAVRTEDGECVTHSVWISVCISVWISVWIRE